MGDSVHGLMREITALHWRVNATSDPAAWEQLADLYAFVGLTANAEACRRRAEHYRKAEENHETDPGLPA